MNFTTTGQSMRVLNVAFDVSSEMLNWSMHLGPAQVDDQCSNQTQSIEKTLRQIKHLADKQGYGEVRVICESTGIYHRNLLRIAGNLGMRTNLVHGEVVSKYRTIQFADHGKTDIKDPQAILTVAQVGRLIKHRQLDSRYGQLREMHRLVLRAERRARACKSEVHSDLRSSFPDLRLDRSLLYGPTGRALIEKFGANPQKIIASGYDSFVKQIKSQSKHTKRATLQRIWDWAEASLSQAQATTVAKIQLSRSSSWSRRCNRFTTSCVSETPGCREPKREWSVSDFCRAWWPRPDRRMIFKRLLS